MSSLTTDGVDEKAGPSGWTLMLPPGWWHVPLDERRGQSLTALLDNRLASLPRDRVATLRRELDGELGRLAERAAENGATDMYLSVDLVQGLPVAATCLVTVVPTGVGTALPAAELAAMMGDQPDDEVGVLEVAGAPAARVRRREPVDEADGFSTGGLPLTRLQVYVPVPNKAETLLLSFSTPIDPIADAMVALFDAIAGSLRWRQT
ncbi:MAG: hypothetical protein M3228_15265 [Actinomycetota bacterium]|nr:hypothetical protein [Actinomycetota bacterium]